ncbi:MAG: hypothetical protein J5854_06705 [Clostridia bacterium]|nr:hypothetical protein [Clostridia bacterium]
MPDTMTVNGIEYRVIRLLGKGKGGYSYLVTDGETEYVIKQIHHEPCDYYSFGNKLETELCDRTRLLAAGILIPKLIDADTGNERILKEYIKGDTAAELIKKGASAEGLIAELRLMAEKAKAAGLNIDYYPTNFVPRDGKLYYIDYECNAYSEEWDLENWGMKYWTGG